ncbi:MAG TPA: phytanoyl-CoA dioxygenase family protein [Stellaceae bacterium]|nr:phytanoyl-CoA dioxygenase family protein [Stellaceae bacterium]
MAVDPEALDTFRRHGAACIKGGFSGWVDVIAAGIERNMREPGPLASSPVRAGEPGHFFDDYCNWQRIPEFARVVRESPAAELAAAFMESDTAQFFHDHVLVKEPGTQKPTPWHQDIPYYFIGGRQTVSFWIPVDPVREATLRFVAGSHLWPRWVSPVRWLDDSSFYGGDADYLPVPDPDNDPSMEVIEWQLEPGDAVAFDFRTVHGARGNLSAGRRRVLSLRWVGDDARYAERPGRTSPPFPGHGMVPGQRLREDWFPVIRPQTSRRPG